MKGFFLIVLSILTAAKETSCILRYFLYYILTCDGDYFMLTLFILSPVVEVCIMTSSLQNFQEIPFQQKNNLKILQQIRKLQPNN